MASPLNCLRPDVMSWWGACTSLFTRGKHAQRLEPQYPLSCPEKGRPYDMHQLTPVSLLSIAYKVLTGVLCERLKPLVRTLIGLYQCGFRFGKYTIGQIFILLQILEKTHES